MNKLFFIKVFCISLTLFAPKISHSHPHEDKQAIMGYVDLQERERLQRVEFSYGDIIDEGIYKLNKIYSDKLSITQTNNPTIRAVTDRFGLPIKDSTGKVVTNPSNEKWGIEYAKIINSLDEGDYEKGLKDLLPLVENGNIHAAFSLGVMYVHGLGVTQNYKKAEELFLLGVEGGLRMAQYNLGYLYLYDKVKVDDSKKIFDLIRLSAEQGYERAFYLLGWMHYNGFGAIQDFVYADMWLNIAEAHGMKEATEARDTLLEYITLSELKTAKKLAQKCVNSFYIECY